VGRLTTDQRNAIEAGGTIAQVFIVSKPTDSTHATYVDSTFEDPYAVVSSAHWHNVVRAGRRKINVFNPSLKARTSGKAARWRFVVRNDGGQFYPSKGYFHVSGYPELQPQECRIKHRVYVWSGPTGSWLKLGPLDYEGGIIDIDYDDIEGPDGQTAPYLATITCEQLGAWEILRHRWTKEDASEFHFISIDWVEP